MQSRPTNASATLLFLLEEWMAVAFPGEDRPVATLNRLWLTLARSLCGPKSLMLDPFQDELARLRRGPRAGYPPLRALEQRIGDLTATGMSELFLVIAVRQGIDQLIAIEFPGAVGPWRELADRLLPVQVQFAWSPDDMPPSSSVYSPR